MNEKLTSYGVFNLKIYENEEARQKGIIKKELMFRNKMTNASLAVISGLVGNTGSQTAFTYLAVGTDSTAVSNAHTALQAEITDSGLARASATVSRATTTQTNDTLQLVKTWTATGTKTIQEIGIFNDASAGTMLARALTGGQAVINTNVITATYKWIVVVN